MGGEFVGVMGEQVGCCRRLASHKGRSHFTVETPADTTLTVTSVGLT